MLPRDGLAATNAASSCLNANKTKVYEGLLIVTAMTALYNDESFLYNGDSFGYRPQTALDNGDSFLY